MIDLFNKMRTFFLIVIVSYSCSAQYDLPTYLPKVKRETSGALDILTNDAHPIHTDIKSESTGTNQVVPPKYEPKSLRKSLPVNSGLDIIRGVSRVVMLVTLVVVAVVEVYPIVYNLYENVYDYFVV